MNDLPQPVATLIEAANANDTDAFLASLAPDAVVDDWGREFHGPSHFTFDVDGDRVARMEIRA